MAGGRRTKPEEQHKKGKKERRRNQEWCREKKDKATADVGIWVMWCCFLCGTHVRPNYRMQAARSEATANQKHAFQLAELTDLFVS